MPFGAIYLAEHHFEVYGRLPAPLAFLARLSGVTQHLGLGPRSWRLRITTPLRPAEDAALLHVVSHGRVRLGIGSGARNKPAEFSKFGISIDEKTTRSLETVEILRQAFDTAVAEFTRQHYAFHDLETNPRPRLSALPFATPSVLAPLIAEADRSTGPGSRYGRAGLV